MRSIPLDTVHYEIVRLKVSDLRVGMYVCELDRPWEETPFSSEGFELESMEDIDIIRRYCRFVHIDLGRTQAVRVKLDKGPVRSFIHIRNHITSLDKEIPYAEATRKQTSNLVKNFLDELRLGHSADIQLAKSAVSQCVASILRNPDAMMLMTLLQEKCQTVSDHAFNVCIYSIILGRLNGFDAERLEEVGACGLLHDIGNIKIPDQILNKTTALSEDEFEVIKRHTVFGREILLSSRQVHPATADVAYGHHECPDGSGYPRGVNGDQINLNCRIVTVADKYEAITRQAAYKTAQNHLDAVHILNTLADNGKIDKKQNSLFVSYLGFYPPGTIIELSSGEVGIVLKSNHKYRLRPQILIVRDADKNPVERFVDLALTPASGKEAYSIKMVHLPGYLGIDISRYQSALVHSYE